MRSNRAFSNRRALRCDLFIGFDLANRLGAGCREFVEPPRWDASPVFGRAPIWAPMRADAVMRVRMAQGRPRSTSGKEPDFRAAEARRPGTLETFASTCSPAFVEGLTLATRGASEHAIPR